MKGRPMRGKTFGTVTQGFMLAGVFVHGVEFIWFDTVWFDTEEDFLLRAPVTEEGYILPENYIKVYEDFGEELRLVLVSESDDVVCLTSQEVLGQHDQPARLGTWRIYRGGPRGLWITWEEAKR